MELSWWDSKGGGWRWDKGQNSRNKVDKGRYGTVSLQGLSPSLASHQGFEVSHFGLSLSENLEQTSTMISKIWLIS